MAAADEIRQKLLGKFREVTADRVEKISSSLLELERGPNPEAMQEITRELHTLKGESRMMGFVGLSQVVHAAEDLLKALSPGKSGDRLDALLRACDAIPAFLGAPPDGGEAAKALADRLRALIASPDGAPALVAASPQPSASPPAPAAASAPAGPAARPGERPKVAGASFEGEGPRAELRGEKPASSIRVDVDRLDEIAALAGDMLVDGARALRRTRELAALLARWNRLSDRVITVTEGMRTEGMSRLAEQIDGDVHLLRSDSFRFLRGHSDSVSSAQGQFTLMAERVGSARLIPISGILAGFPRAARDLAREQGKEVECVVQGGDTGVDKAILLSLNDPMVHLLRNAMDHGIESPQEREKAGKPRVGRITISARTDGDMLAVTLEDDGRGIDPERVRAAAVRKGVVTEAQAASFSPRAVMDLIFLPGFSTRDEAGELSGRGVGLDVVRKKVTNLGGAVVLDSELGRGTRFSLRMPQSLSLMKVLLVRIDEDIYGIPAIDVESVGRLNPEDMTEVAGIRTVRHRERLMPVVALGPLLSLNGGPRSPRPMTAYVRHGDDGAALVVDGLYGEREVSVKAPSAFIKGMRFVSGAAALEDGRVALLLSTPDVVNAARRLSSPALSRSRDRRRVRILLVDDSAIAREAEAALLRSLGHEVEEGVDGEDGWQKLQSGTHQLLLTDVQMPVLDGIDLTRRVKATPRFAKLPIVILSSLSAPEERRRGVDAGADAYLVKGELDAEVLASTLERLCGVAR